jgi:hypothetical protein
MSGTVTCASCGREFDCDDPYHPCPYYSAIHCYRLGSDPLEGDPELAKRRRGRPNVLRPTAEFTSSRLESEIAYLQARQLHLSELRKELVRQGREAQEEEDPVFWLGVLAILAGVFVLVLIVGMAMDSSCLGTVTCVCTAIFGALLMKVGRERKAARRAKPEGQMPAYGELQRVDDMIRQKQAILKGYQGLLGR